MPLFSETESKIFGDIMIDVVNNTPVTRGSNGAKMRALVEAVSKKMGRMWAQFDLNMGLAFIDGANGRYLNFIGEMLGVSRLGEEAANISSFDLNLKFYVDVGNFGTINSGSSITIPAGTIISTGQDQTGTKYRTLINTVLPSASSDTYITARSIGSGESVNVGARRLNYHNFSNYTDVLNNSLKVTNTSEIVLGQNVESDANYKYRIINQVVAAENANTTAIRLAALVIPGVADITLIPYYRGIGSYDLLVRAVTPTVPQSLLDAVESAVTSVTAQGIVPRIRGPKEVGISLTGTIVLKKVVTAAERTAIVENVTTNVTDYINSLNIAEEFILNEVIERVMSTSNTIKTVGVSGKPFDSVYKYTPSKLEDNKVRSTVITDIVPKQDEKLYVEDRYAGETPILFRIA